MTNGPPYGKAFGAQSTNIDAILSLTNIGPRTIYWLAQWQLAAETQSGWTTNDVVFTGIPVGTPPASNMIFNVSVPRGTLRWEVTTCFEVGTRRMALSHWMMQKGFPRAAWQLLNYAWPSPPEKIQEISSDLLTNRPDSALRQ